MYSLIMRKAEINYACQQLCIPANLGVFTADGPWHSSILTDNANVALNLLVWQYLDTCFNCMCCQKVLEKRSVLGLVSPIICLFLRIATLLSAPRLGVASSKT